MVQDPLTHFARGALNAESRALGAISFIREIAQLNFVVSALYVIIKFCRRPLLMEKMEPRQKQPCLIRIQRKSYLLCAGLLC